MQSESTSSEKMNLVLNWFNSFMVNKVRSNSFLDSGYKKMSYFPIMFFINVTLTIDLLIL